VVKCYCGMAEAQDKEDVEKARERVFERERDK
jgi:hypothetical protein